MVDSNWNSDKLRKAATGVSWLTVASASEYVIALAVLAILARLLSPAEFGIASLALSFLTFARLFSQVDMAGALIRRKDISDSHIDVAFSIVIALGTITAAFLALSASTLADFFDVRALRQILWVVALLVPINAIASIGYALLSRRGAFRFLALSTFPGRLVGYCGTSVTLAYLGFGVWSLIIGMFVQELVTALFVLFAARHRPRFRWTGPAFRELLHFGMGQTLARAANYGANNGDNFVVARLLGVEALGLYGRAYKLMTLPVEVISSAVYNVAFPLMSEIQDEPRHITRAYKLGVSMLATLLIPLSVLAIFSARPLVLLVLGPRWMEVVLPTQILFVSLTFRATYRHINLATIIKGRSYSLALLNLIFATEVVLGAIGAALYFGTISAVATAVALALFCHYLLCARSANHFLSVSWIEFGQMHSPGLMTGAALTIALIPVQHAGWFGSNTIVDLLSYFFASAITFFVCAYLSPRLFLGSDNLPTFSRIFSLIPCVGPTVSGWIDSVHAPSERT